MFENSLINNLAKSIKTATLLTFLMAPGPATAFEVAENACIDADFIPLNTSLRSYGSMEGTAQYFKLEVPQAGLVTMDVAVPGSTEIEAKLGLFGRGCDTPSPFESNSVLIEQTPTHMAFMADAPGTYVFAVAAQDPRSSLGEYRLTAGFAAEEIYDPGGTHSGPIASHSESDDGENPDEIELEPDLRIQEPPLTTASNSESDDGENPDEIELEPDLRGGSGGPWPPTALLRLASQELCRQLGSDDHGDTSMCATRILPGRKAKGTLGNPWGDDYDLFAFTLIEPRTVHLSTAGPTDTFGALLDRHGHLLAADDDGGNGGNFHIVKTLSPGLYFVRVEGTHAAEGPYALRVEARTW